MSDIKIITDMVIADAGATGHFVLPGALVKNTVLTSKPLTINLKTGNG